jgi:hypothetical protein
MAGIIVLSVLCMVYPFLPGKHDALALPLSIIAQLFGAAGLLLVPIGALWLVHEARKRGRIRIPPTTDRGYYFAMASLIVASIAAFAVSLFISSMGVSFGVLALSLWVYSVSRLIPRLRLLKRAEAKSINPAPFYLLLEVLLV